MHVVGEHRDFKFGVQVDHSKSWPMDDNPSLIGARSHDPFLMLSPPKISLEQLKIDT